MYIIKRAHLGLFYTDYSVLSSRSATVRHFQWFDKIHFLIEAQIIGSFDRISDIIFVMNTNYYYQFH